jgi:hypothetical protein
MITSRVKELYTLHIDNVFMSILYPLENKPPPFFSSRHGPDRGGGLYSNMLNSPRNIRPLQQMALLTVSFPQVYNARLAIVGSLLIFWAPTQQQEEALRSDAVNSAILARLIARLPPPSKKLLLCFFHFHGRGRRGLTFGTIRYWQSIQINIAATYNIAIAYKF